MKFVLSSNDQFGTEGPQKGAVGVVLYEVAFPEDDERWYWTNFDGFEGDYIVADYMVDFL